MKTYFSKKLGQVIKCDMISLFNCIFRLVKKEKEKIFFFLVIIEIICHGVTEHIIIRFSSALIFYFFERI